MSARLDSSDVDRLKNILVGFGAGAELDDPPEIDEFVERWAGLPEWLSHGDSCTYDDYIFELRWRDLIEMAKLHLSDDARDVLDALFDPIDAEIRAMTIQRQQALWGIERPAEWWWWWRVPHHGRDWPGGRPVAVRRR